MNTSSGVGSCLMCVAPTKSAEEIEAQTNNRRSRPERKCSTVTSKATSSCDGALRHIEDCDPARPESQSSLRIHVHAVTGAFWSPVPSSRHNKSDKARAHTVSE